MKWLPFLGCCFFSLTLSAQVPFVTSGKILYEKKIDLHQEFINDFRFKKSMDGLPKYYTAQHQLLFSGNATLYEASNNITEKNSYFTDDGTDNDIMYSDLKKGVYAKKKKVFEETFFVSDSIRHIKWQMTNDTRMIAGFECHKAIAIILDSIYVIAFYTDQITVCGGPMSFCNLPGMILGIAIPRLNMTVIATKVELSFPPEKLSPPPVEGDKRLDYKGLRKLIGSIVSRFDTESDRKYAIRAFL
jgi:GLPGLI family protein